jgi:hypothetical protein
MSRHKYQQNDDLMVEAGLNDLRSALEYFTIAGCRKTADRIRLAISSAKGAVRNVGYRRGRYERALKGQS